uniref:Cyclin dependent kinase inhibitor 2A n=1 Tax=Leptobrachium leishanense TaxID=445787 RepID=A0A8C5LQQ5_9ANUR
MASEGDLLASAAARGDLELAKEMLEKGAEPNGTNSQGRTPIQVMMMGSPKMAELLLKHGANPRVPDPLTGTCPAHDAAREGFLDTLLILYQGGASLQEPCDRYGMRPIDLAPDWMKDKLKQNYILLMFSCQSGCVELPNERCII